LSGAGILDTGTLDFACRLERPGFHFDVAFSSRGGVVALFGASGSGKSTAIRLIAGLERPEAGRIIANGEVLLDTAARLCVAPHRRRLGLVFQDPLLFPHLNVRKNLTYARRFHVPGEHSVDLDRVIGVLGLERLLDRRPDTLSGGEKSRVAIGRALLSSPRLLLMDEPLAALDAPRRLEILPFIETVRDVFGIGIVYVSHAVDEVARLARHIVRLDAGRVVASGTPADLFQLPTRERAQERFEAVSVLNGKVARHLDSHDISVIAHAAGEISLPGRQARPGTAVRILVKATQVSLATRAPEGLSVRTQLAGVIATISVDDGPFALVRVTLTGGETLLAHVTRLAVDELGLAPGREVLALVKASTLEERAT